MAKTESPSAAAVAVWAVLFCFVGVVRMAERTNSTGDPVEVCGYAYTSVGESPPAERVGHCVVCGTLTFNSFSKDNTACIHKDPGGSRVVLCAHRSTDSHAYAQAERMFGRLELD